MADWHALEEKEVFKILRSSENGLNRREIDSRLEYYGKNELVRKSGLNPFFILMEQFKSVFVLILLAAAVFSFFIQHYVDFSVILVIVIINSTIGFFQQFKAEKTIERLKESLVPMARVIREGKMEEIPSSELVPGDIMVISEGDKIMADCRLIYVKELQTDESALTGESFPQEKISEALNLNTSLTERKNICYLGTIAVRGNARAIVVSTGMTTEFGKIAGLVQEIKKKKNPLEQKLDSFSKRVAVAVLILAAITTGIGLLRGEDAFDMVLAGIALAVSVIPEGLPAVIAITLAFAIQRMEKHNALIRKLPAAETLGRTTVICTDKTGTITEEKMQVRKIYVNGVITDEFEKNKETEMLFRIGALCNNARIEQADTENEYILGDPTEKALILAAKNYGIDKERITIENPRIEEYPFSSQRKMMSIVRMNKEQTSYTKGAPEVILENCSHELNKGKITAINEKRRKEIIMAYEELASKGMRVLGFAFKSIIGRVSMEKAEKNMVFSGFQAMIDPPRPEVREAIKECNEAGIKIVMITGDSLQTAVEVGREIGLTGKAITSVELSKMSDDKLAYEIENISIFARISPEDKLRIIKILKKNQEVVAVTGDGINDAPALKSADIGVAVNRGTDVAKDSSDIILLDNNFATIVQAVREGRRVYDNMRKSIQAHISANADELFVVLFALAFAFPLPMLPLAILWMNLITDSLPSIALGVEPAEKDLMKRKPINPRETILTDIWKFILAAGIITFVIAIALFLMFYKTDIDKARTMVITSAVFCEMFVVIASKSKSNIWKLDFLGNKFLIFSIGLAILLQLIAVYTPLGLLFGFKAIPFWEMLLVFALSFLTLIFLEGFKYLWKRE